MMTLDEMLFMLEKCAMQQDKELEKVEGYTRMCEILTDYEFDHIGYNAMPVETVVWLLDLIDRLVDYVLPCWRNHKFQLYLKPDCVEVTWHD